MWGNSHRWVVAFTLLAAACGDNLGGNTAPTVDGLQVTTDEDTPLTRALDVADADGDAIEITLGHPIHGTVTMGTGGSFTYTPEANFHGADGFNVTVSDGKLEGTATVSITVTSVNDPPAGVADSFATNEDAAHTADVFALLANDTDIEGDTLTVTAVGDAVNGTVQLVGSDVTFTPDPDFNGDGSYRYTVSDGTDTTEVDVTVTVGGVNDAPIAVDDTATTDEDTDLVVTGAALVANDLDADGNTLTVTAVGNEVNGTVALASGTVTFTPDANFAGTASFEYTVSDGQDTDTATVTVTVTAVNDAPVANPDTATTDEDTPVTVTEATMLANDTDAEGDTLTVTGATNPVGGTVAFAGGDVTFTPTANFTGAGSFDYTVSDGTDTATGTVTITIAPVNDPPVAIDDLVTTAEDTAVVVTSGTLSGNDLDVDGDTLAVQSVGTASVGTVVRDGTSGDITYTPPADFTGTATFDYVVTDGTLTDTGTVTVVVTAVDDAPVATDDTASTAEDTPIVLTGATLTGNDTDVDGDPLTVTAVANETNGTASLAGGDVTFTPAANFNGTATFEYTVSDGGLTDTATVTITVTAANDAPIANPDTAVAESAIPTNFTTAQFLANDADVEADPLTITAVDNPSDGGTVLLAGNTITYTSAIGFAGDASFEYTVSDGNGGTATGTVTVTVVINTCGDGFILGLEACDDGNDDDGDGCSALCAVEAGWTCNGEPTTCTPICGDGLVVGDEPCDDDNPDDTDGCTTECLAAVVCDATAFPGGDRFAVDAFTGTCYVSFDTEQTTFADAQTACVGAGGHLATITSAAEDTLVRGVQNASENPWIGGVDDANTTDAVFTWVTGEPFTFTSFDTGEPDDDVGVGGNGDCLHLNPNGAWADTNCTLDTFVAGRICEIEVDACHDGVVHPGEECQDTGAGDNCSETCEVEDGCGDGNLDAGEQCDDDNLANGDGCSATCETETLFISEYVEGSSSNKAVEIRNPSATSTFDFATTACSLRLYSNGSATASATVALTGTIAPNDVFVVCNGGAVPAITSVCDQTSNTVINYNGDDAVELVCGGTTLDVLGQIGVDPGTEWGTGLTSTADNTLRRKCQFRNGDADGSDVFDPALEWDGFAVDTFGGIGVAECVP